MKKFLLCLSGWLLLAVAAVGIFVPVLPTTPLVLAAAACFWAGSPALYRRLEGSFLFGPYIKGWRSGQGITAGRKAAAIATLWGLLAISAIHVGRLWLTLLLAAVGVAVTAHLLLLRTKKRQTDSVATRETGS